MLTNGLSRRIILELTRHLFVDNNVAIFFLGCEGWKVFSSNQLQIPYFYAAGVDVDVVSMYAVFKIRGVHEHSIVVSSGRRKCASTDCRNIFIRPDSICKAIVVFGSEKFYVDNIVLL